MNKRFFCISRLFFADVLATRKMVPYRRMPICVTVVDNNTLGCYIPWYMGGGAVGLLLLVGALVPGQRKPTHYDDFAFTSQTSQNQSKHTTLSNS